MSANKTGPDALRPLLLAFEPVFFMITLMKLGVFINAILFHYNFSLKVVICTALVTDALFTCFSAHDISIFHHPW